MGNQRLYDVMKEKDALYEKEDFTDEDGVKASELEAEFADKTAAPYEAAKRGYVDEIIDPVETRQAVVYALGLLSTKD